MVRVGRGAKPLLTQAEQIILTHQTQNPLVIDDKTTSAQFFGDGAIAVVGHLDERQHRIDVIIVISNQKVNMDKTTTEATLGAPLPNKPLYKEPIK